jgi:murein L,D-transpeptidase YcbB/YkuD
VPIYISYLTARPDGETIAFADDVYKLDGEKSGGQTIASTAAKK